MTPRENENNSMHVDSVFTDQGFYDLSILEEMEDNEYTIEIISIFLKDTPVELKEIQEALRTGKAEIISKKAHKLKSSAGILQAKNLVTFLTGIESLSKSPNPNEELTRLLDSAHQEYKNIEQALKKHLKGIS
jgi:HPt (histidine-containing phosphotransfer) domain-containing protein